MKREVKVVSREEAGLRFELELMIRAVYHATGGDSPDLVDADYRSNIEAFISQLGGVDGLCDLHAACCLPSGHTRECMTFRP